MPSVQNKDILLQQWGDKIDMALLLRPNRGGFLTPFGCGWFIREFLLGHGPEGAPKIDAEVGACQEDIFYHYKLALIGPTLKMQSPGKTMRGSGRVSLFTLPRNTLRGLTGF